MLVINLEGAQTLLALLNNTSKGNLPSETEIQAVLAANKFFMGFYSRWKGITIDSLVETMCRFHQPDYQPESPVLSALAKGFKPLTTSRSTKFCRSFATGL